MEGVTAVSNTKLKKSIKNMTSWPKRSITFTIPCSSKLSSAGVAYWFIGTLLNFLHDLRRCLNHFSYVLRHSGVHSELTFYFFLETRWKFLGSTEYDLSWTVRFVLKDFWTFKAFKHFMAFKYIISITCWIHYQVVVYF